MEDVIMIEFTLPERDRLNLIKERVADLMFGLGIGTKEMEGARSRLQDRAIESCTFENSDPDPVEPSTGFHRELKRIETSLRLGLKLVEEEKASIKFEEERVIAKGIIRGILDMMRNDMFEDPEVREQFFALTNQFKSLTARLSRMDLSSLKSFLHQDRQGHDEGMALVLLAGVNACVRVLTAEMALLVEALERDPGDMFANTSAWIMDRLLEDPNVVGWLAKIEVDIKKNINLEDMEMGTNIENILKQLPQEWFKQEVLMKCIEEFTKQF